jgi:hypothetical protein
MKKNRDRVLHHCMPRRPSRNVADLGNDGQHTAQEVGGDASFKTDPPSPHVCDLQADEAGQLPSLSSILSSCAFSCAYTSTITLRQEFARQAPQVRHARSFGKS